MKKVLLFLGIIIFIQNNSWAQIPTDSLKGYWPLNGDANDNSSFKNDGIVSGATLSTGRFNCPNTAYEFDGVDDVIDLPSKTFSNVSSLTYSIWVNTPLYTGDRWLGFIGSWDEMEYKNNDLGIWQNTGHLHLEVYTNNGYYPMEGKLDIPWNTWFHAALVYDGDSLREYINGVPGKAIHAAGNLATITNLKLGQASPNQPTFNGKLDDVRIYNRALSPVEIERLYNESYCDYLDSNLITVYDTIHVEVFDTTYVTIYDSIAVTDTLIINIVTEITPSLTTSSILIYPNPAHDVFSIILPFPASLTIFDLTGKVVLKRDFLESGVYSIDNKMFSPGVYQVVLCGREKMHTSKLVIL